VIYWTAFALITVVAYLWPGYALLSCVELEGVGRWGRLLFALPTSLIVVPFFLVAISNFAPFVPALWQVLAVGLALAACSWVLRTKHRLALIRVVPRNQDSFPGSRLEWLLALGFCALFAVVTCLPRLDALVGGDLATTVGPGDASWQLARAVSVARSGLPPSHYFLPDLKLTYYYWSVIYPALLSNQPLLHVSLAQAVSVATVVQTAAFLAVFYLVLRLSLRTVRARIAGILLITIMGGLDGFAALGKNLGDLEWWQTKVPWIANGFQISSPITWFMWVPQHVAGAMVFLVCLLLWRNVRGPNLIRSACLGLVFGFAFGTSAWVFLAMALALGLWFLLCRGWRLARRGAPFAILAFGVFLVGSWKQILLERTSAAGLQFANFRVPLLEAYLGIQTAKAQLLDHLLTLLGAPVVLSWVLLIEMGSAFVLYLAFLARRRFGRSAWERFLAVFPLVCLLLILVFRSSDNLDDLVMRGVIPAQVCMILAAATVVDRFEWKALRLRRKAFSLYFGLALILVQLVWPLEEIGSLSAPALGAAFDAKADVRVRGLLVAQAVRWPEELAYIHWANEHTAPDAVFIESGLSGEQQDLEFLHLERMRYLPADAIRTSLDPSTDMSLKGLADWQGQLGKGTLLCEAVRSPYVRARASTLYYVARGAAEPSSGTLVYQDNYVHLYLVTPSVRQRCDKS
jgi:hypothetical protein